MNVTGNNDKPMTHAEMAAQMRQHAAESTSSVAARRYRYEHGLVNACAAIEADADVCNPSMPEVDGDMLTWVCSRCGSWLSDNQVGTVHQGRLTGNQMMMVECPVCRGVAYSIEQLNAIRDEEEQAMAREQVRKQKSLALTTCAGILFLVLPGMVEYLLLIIIAMWIGPLRTLDIKTKMGVMIITGAVMCINVFTAGLLGMGFLTGQWFSYVTATGITVMSLGMALVVDRVGSLGGGLFYR